MKRILLFFLLLMAIAMQGKENFADAKADLANIEASEYHKEKQVIENLFKQRAALWNSVYDDINFIDKFEKELQKLVADPLLAADLEAFEAAKNYPSDLDLVLDLKVIDIDDVIYGRTKMNASVKINWKMQSVASYYYEEIDYKVILIKSDSSWKLYDFSTIQ